MVKKYVFAAALCATALLAESCKTQKAVFSKTGGGLEYWIVRDVPGGRAAEAADFMDLHIKSHIQLETRDTILYDSRTMNNNAPILFQVTMPPRLRGDISEGLLKLTEGDSAVFRIPVDSMDSDQLYSWMERGKNLKVEYTIKVARIRAKTEAPAMKGNSDR